MNRQEKGLDLAVESVRQQITLASAIIAATLAFSDQLQDTMQGRVWTMLPYAFAPLALSIICGVLALMSISFHLCKNRDPMPQSEVRLFGVCQNLSFMLSVIGLVLIVAIA
ncbi:MAG: hypothetical protein F6J97_23015 [Leptolyngbya sp. SIO4C1]|nr:hypothetical protein [Leptolyngbya sp. SIO4C1]